MPQKQNIFKAFLIAVFCLALFGGAGEARAVPAFPEAQGAGAESIGGRGGRVIYVTNLNNEGPGSLREAMEASGPRIVVFKVGGIIHLQRTAMSPRGYIYIDHPFLTVAGQTAPGGGITVHGSIYIQARDVILRYLTIRLGNATNTSSQLYGGGVSGGGGASNLIVDHVSISWAHDDATGTWATNRAVQNVTYSWNLIGEGLRDWERGTCQGMIFGGSTVVGINTSNVDIHHNAMMKFTNRYPHAKIKDIRITNNLMYYGLWYMTQLSGGIQADIIGNVYKRIPADRYEVQVWENPDSIIDKGLPGSPLIYIAGNKGPHQPNPDNDNWSMVRFGDTNLDWKRTPYLPLPSPRYPVIIDPASNLENIVLNDVGNSRKIDENGNWVRRRDSVDARLVNEYRNNTGILPWQTSNAVPWQETAEFASLGGWPTIASGTPYIDSDNDGMSNVWETAHGLNPNVADNNGDADSDGYTNIEEFLNGGGEIPVPGPDNIDPVITITCPPTGQTYSSNTISLSGTASDNIGVSKVEVKVGSSGTYQLATGATSWSISGITIAAGSNTVYARATDTSGNTKETFIQVTYDSTVSNLPPSCTASAAPAPCGNGAIDTGEACDTLGNIGCLPTAACNSSCTACVAPPPPPPICYGVICNTPGFCQAGIGECVATSLTSYVCTYNDDPDPCDLDGNVCTYDVCKSSDGGFSGSCIATNLNICKGIVPCGREINNPLTSWDETAPCEFCHLILILNRVMNFLMELTAIISLLAIIITGLLFIISAGNSEIKNKAKTALKWIIIGLIIVFLAWLLIDFLLSAWGYVDPLGGKWNVIC